MKKFTSLLAMAMMAMMSFTLSSCDEDEEIADTLWGTWEGEMYVVNEWNGHTYQSSYSVIQFDKDPYNYASSGTGYWVDYFSDAPWDYFASHIEWVVRNERIQIYSYEDDTYFEIRNYSLSDNYFRGELEDEYGGWQSFSLRKTSSPYWNYGWGWGHYPGYVNKKKSTPKVPFDNNTGNKPVRKIRNMEK